MVRFFLALIVAMVAMVAMVTTMARAQTVEPGDLRLEVSFEEREGPLYTGEMVLLKIRGFYKIRIARETLEQGRLDGFDWMQLGEDTWTKDTTKGHEILQMERIIALFPNRAGTLEIAPFTHKLELWTRTGERYDHAITSEPITIEVTDRPETEGWWLPARRITVQDRWSNAPDKLGTGEGALRIVMVTVEGIRPEQMPPMPKLESAGAFVFPHPEKRITRLYKRGPVTRAFWRWTIRPENPPSAYLKPLHVPYFDTLAREHREIVIASQRIAMTEEAVAAYLAEADSESVAVMKERPNRREAAGATPYLAGIAAPLGLFGGLIGGVLLLWPGMRWRKPRRIAGIWSRLRPDPDLRLLKQAAAQGDTATARAAGQRLMTRSPGDGARMTRALQAVDRAIYSARPAAPDLKAFVSEMQKAHRIR